MPAYPFMQIDAFADRPLAGNPCVVVFEADDLSDETMLAVAKEMNLSETAFVRRSTVADFGARYFTPAREIPLAGHPTIATTFAMVHSGRLPLPANTGTYSLELKDGPITVAVFAEGGVVSQIVMTQRKPKFLTVHDPETGAANFWPVRRGAAPRSPDPDGQHRHTPTDDPGAHTG